MQKPFAVSQSTLREIAQTFQQIKSMARTIESAADSLIPLTDDKAVADDLNAVYEHAELISKIANRHYHSIARDALKE
jgi:hypothetical protein